jgi:hypothetical protein
MSQDQHPGAEGDFFVTFFLVVSDQDRSRNFYQSVFGGKVLLERDPVILEVANARVYSRGLATAPRKRWLQCCDIVPILDRLNE